MQKQVDRLFNYLKKHKSITNGAAFVHLGIMANPRRIMDLKEVLPKSYRIAHEKIYVNTRFSGKQRVTQYRLVRL
jgi:hypothetical protein